MSSLCIRCKKSLTQNEIGAYMKFVNRDSKEFLCKSCLSKKLNIPENVIDKKIEDFKRQGCTLFV